MGDDEAVSVNPRVNSVFTINEFELLIPRLFNSLPK